jgi:hypothetical protein
VKVNGAVAVLGIGMVPFDNIGYRAVLFDLSDWDSHVDAKTQIAEAASNALTQGSAISNPVTHARGWKKLKASADSEQAIVANLVEDVAVLKKVLSAVRDHLNDPETIEAVRWREEARQNLIKALKNSLE